MALKRIKNQRCQTCFGSGRVTPLLTTLNIQTICNDCGGYGYRVIFANEKKVEKAIRVDQLQSVEAYF